MVKFFFLFVMVMTAMLGCSGCGGETWTYRQGQVPTHINHTYNIPIWIDSSFSVSQKAAIRDAIKEWNGVFNGQVVLKAEATFTGIEEGDKLLQQANRTGQGWVIINLPHNHPLFDNLNLGGVLAFVRGAGGHLMVVIGDQIGSRNLKSIVMHEMGHLLGANHVNAPSLMMPAYSHTSSNCIDKITVAQVAGYYKLDMGTLNYCITPHFE
jgi:predicted Zn-dependent protease